MKQPVVLKVYRGQRLISVKQFLSPQIVIGRQSDAGLNLDDEAVAPMHAVIEKRGEDFFLSDLGSAEGVTIEGQRVLESKIEHGEALGVGPYSVRFYIGVPSPPIEPDYSKTHIPPIMENKEEEQEEAQASENEKEPLVENEFGAEEEVGAEPTNPGEKGFEFIEQTDPGLVKEQEGENKKEESAAINIVSRNVEETLSSQKYEPISSGYVAPASSYEKVEDIINPYSRGSVLEVVLAWKERVIETHHFLDKKSIYLANDESSDIYVPLMGNAFRHKFISFDDECVIHIANSMSGQVYSDGTKKDLTEIKNSPMLTTSSKGSDFKLDQGQMLKLDLMGDRVSLFMRYVEDAPVATKSPVFDFSSSEVIGIFMAAASVLIVALYMLFYIPGELGDTDKLLEDRLKKAVITFNPPPRVKTQIPEQKKITPLPPKRTTKVSEKRASDVKKPKNQIKAGTPNPGLKTSKPGKPKNAAPSRVKSNSVAGSSRPGGSVKTGKKAASAKSKKPDLTKTGILSALSGGGKNTALDKVYSGTGTTVGTADSKTGAQGQLSDQAGDGIGTKLQKAGKGGTGSALAGVGDVKTSGRGGGSGSYGQSGLGGKGSTTILNVDAGVDDFNSSIDKEAIRRLIRRNKNALKGCYDRVLTQNSRLRGKVVLSWEIVSGGRMRNPRVVSTTLKNSQVENCIIRRLQALTFPSPAANETAVVEDYPFVFEAAN